LHPSRNSRRSAPPASLPDLIGHLKAQRQKIAALSIQTGTLQSRGMRLLAESNSLAERVQLSCTDLAKTFLSTKTAVAKGRLRRSRGPVGSPLPSEKPSERVLADSPEVIDALQQATEILKMEFSETEGSGRQTLVKCEKALQRTRSTQTIELSLY
jgi:hypothetical protein